MYMYVIRINIKGTTEFEEGVWKGLQKKLKGSLPFLTFIKLHLLYFALI